MYGAVLLYIERWTIIKKCNDSVILWHRGIRVNDVCVCVGHCLDWPVYDWQPWYVDT